LREAVRRKRPEAWTNKSWMLHHDKAPAHVSLLIHEFLTKHETDDSCTPAAFLSRFGSCGLSLVSEVEILTKRTPISDGRGDKRKFDTGPSRHTANTSQDAFQNWKKRWERCFKSGGEYFSGDKFD